MPVRRAGADPGPFHEVLVAARRRAGLTQEELARRAGLSVDAIGLLERGARRRPQRHTLDRLAGALALSAAERERLETAARPEQRPPARGLPPMPTPFVGREDDVAAVTALLGTARLVTLLGPGGVGKTRLAIEVAGRVAERFADGAVFVSLAELRGPGDAVRELVRSLGLADGAGPRAIELLESREMLVVLDNAEHLADVSALAADLVAGCPRLRLLVTSRTPLAVAAEQRLPVPVLPVPDDVSSAAVEIFTQRARAVVPDFAIGSSNSVDVVAICRRLDGLPLAIELAAPWLRVLTPAQLLQRLDQRLELLTGGARDAPQRQQTLRNLLRWSHDLLPPRQREVFAGLGVFVGGITEEAAHAVVGATLTDLTALLDANLLAADLSGSPGPRFRMLETVRHFALEQGGQDQRAHAEYHQALVERAEIIGPDETDWKQRLAAADADLHAAIDHALLTGDIAMAAAFARGLWRYWSSTGQLAYGHRRLEAVLALAERADPPALLRAEITFWTASLARAAGQLDRAGALYVRCLAMRPAVGAVDTLVAAAHNLGVVAYESGDYAEAARLEEAALAEARQRASGYGIPFALVSLGDVELAAGRPADATAHYREGLDLFRGMGHAMGIAQALAGLARLAGRDGRRDEAVELFTEALDLVGDLADPLVVDCLEGLAGAHAARAEIATATELLAAADALRDRTGAVRTAFQRLEHARLAALLG